MSTVAMPAYPLYDTGVLTRALPRKTQSVRQPAYPLYDGWALHGFGADPAKIVGASAPIAATTTTAILANTAWASAAGPIGAAVGLVIGVIAGLWAAHEARAKGAKDENAAVNSAVTAFDGAMHAIFDAANSSDPTKNIPASTAAQLVQQQFQTFWQSMAPHMSGPGRADRSGGGANCAALAAAEAHSQQCNKSCTASCCVGCMDLYPGVQSALAVFQNPSGGTANFPEVYGSKYGAVTRGSYSLTYNPPSSVGGSLFGASGGGSLLPLALIAAAVLAFR